MSTLKHSETAWVGQALSDGGWLALIDARARVIGAFLYALAAVICHSLPLLFALAIGGVAFCFIAKISPKKVLRRLLAVELFILFLVILLPFTMPGDPLFVLFGLPASAQGVELGCAILLRANAVAAMLMALLGSMSAVLLAQALAALGLPSRLTMLCLFTVRYLEVIGKEFRRMRQCMRARAFEPKSNLHTWRSMGHLLGSVLLRALARGERVYLAMRCRGFNGQFPLLQTFSWTWLDSLFVVLFLTLTVGIFSYG